LPLKRLSEFGSNVLVHTLPDLEGYVGLIFKDACHVLLEIEYDADSNQFYLLVNDF